MGASWDNGPKDGHVFFRYESDDSLRWHVQRLDKRVARMERSLTLGRARGGQFHGKGGFERLRVRLATDRLEWRRARIELRARSGDDPRATARLHWIGECMHQRKEVLHRWRDGRRLLHEIERAEAGCKDDGRPYPPATLRAYRNRLPDTREQWTRSGHELTLLAERTWVTWRARREGSPHPRRKLTARHLRVLVGGRA